MKTQERHKLLHVVKARFEKNMHRHQGVAWSRVQGRVLSRPQALESLQAMEATGGEPDVVGVNETGGGYFFCDCSPGSPPGRRSLCYDRAALDSRKENRPKGKALGRAAGMGIALLTEEQYRHLQALGTFDTTTSSWITTPEDVRSLGGALFCDRRFARVFVYRNGAASYYAARGFGGALLV